MGSARLRHRRRHPHLLPLRVSLATSTPPALRASTLTPISPTAASPRAAAGRWATRPTAVPAGCQEQERATIPTPLRPRTSPTPPTTPPTTTTATTPTPLRHPRTRDITVAMTMWRCSHRIRTCTRRPLRHRRSAEKRWREWRGASYEVTRREIRNM